MISGGDEKGKNMWEKKSYNNKRLLSLFLVIALMCGMTSATPLLAAENKNLPEAEENTEVVEEIAPEAEENTEVTEETIPEGEEEIEQENDLMPNDQEPDDITPDSDEEPVKNTGNEAVTYANSIHGKLWIDMLEDADNDIHSGNGIYEEGEAFLAGYTVNLYQAEELSNAVQMTVTDETGEYKFTNMEPGNYIVGISASAVDGVEYLLPYWYLDGMEGDNRFVAVHDSEADAYLNAYTRPIEITENTTITDIDGGMRILPEIQTRTKRAGTMTAGTMTTGIINLYDVDETTGLPPGVTFDGSEDEGVLIFGNGTSPEVNYIITTEDADNNFRYTGKHIAVSPGVKVNITLDGVGIKANGIYQTGALTWVSYPLIKMDIQADVNLILNRTNHLSIEGNSQCAGIYVAKGATLAIGEQAGSSGSLRVGLGRDARGGAAIGGNNNTDCGKIRIKSGTVDAIGGGGYPNNITGTGIGGGRGGSFQEIKISGGVVTAKCIAQNAAVGSGSAIGCGSGSTSNGRIEISGADTKVTAEGGKGGAGIGGSIRSHYSGIITISSSTVTAVGGENASGIGGGERVGSDGSYSGKIEISGDADVTATGNHGGAGIGGGNNLPGGEITISGSTVKATGGGNGGAGIGGGNTGSGGIITISSGTVKATGGGNGGAGIGGGNGGDGGEITISSNSVINAEGTGKTAGGAGIGGGNGGTGGEITISGSEVKAKGGNGESRDIGSVAYGGAGIGGGTRGIGGEITISDSRVEAEGGAARSLESGNANGGAGIGGGSGGIGGKIVISSSVVNAKGGAGESDGPEADGGAGIGGGSSGAGGMITINGSSEVTAEGGAANMIRGWRMTDVRSAVRSGAGIGGGGAGAGGTIIINENSTVTAGSGVALVQNGVLRGNNANSGAGIGSGGNSQSGDTTITISGDSEVTAAGNAASAASTRPANDNYGSGAGIGAGGTSVESIITISGGKVNAMGGSAGGAGIGSGKDSAGSRITISRGTVTAAGGGLANTGGAGIGGGDKSSAGSIEISGGRVTATGGSGTEAAGGAGIGGGNGGHSDKIKISGGRIEAAGGKRGAGIGGGNGGSSGSAEGNITISGGTVTATKGDGEDTNVAAIGYGYGGGGTVDSVIFVGGSINPGSGKVMPLPKNGSQNGGPKGGIPGGDIVGMIVLPSRAGESFSITAVGTAQNYIYSGIAHDDAGYIWLAHPSASTDEPEIIFNPAEVALPSTEGAPVIEKVVLNGTYYLPDTISAEAINRVYFEWDTGPGTAHRKDIEDYRLNSSLEYELGTSEIILGATYRYRFVIETNAGIVHGQEETFILAEKPSVQAGHSKSGNDVTLNGIYNLNGGEFLGGMFEISTDEGETWETLTSTSTVPISDAEGVTEEDGQLTDNMKAPSVTLTDLPLGTYWYRFSVRNNIGTTTIPDEPGGLEVFKFEISGYTVTLEYKNMNGTLLDPDKQPDPNTATVRIGDEYSKTLEELLISETTYRPDYYTLSTDTEGKYSLDETLTVAFSPESDVTVTVYYINTIIDVSVSTEVGFHSTVSDAGDIKADAANGRIVFRNNSELAVEVGIRKMEVNRPATDERLTVVANVSESTVDRRLHLNLVPPIEDNNSFASGIENIVPDTEYATPVQLGTLGGTYYNAGGDLGAYTGGSGIFEVGGKYVGDYPVYPRTYDISVTFEFSLEIIG